MLQEGIKGTQELAVTEAVSAKTMKSGTLDVFATPSMIALMEETAWKSVAPHLDAGQGTVGTMLNVKHLAATPLGMTVQCESQLTEIDGRRLAFNITVTDEAGIVGEGTHERFIIQEEKFQKKADHKKESTGK